MKNKMVGLLVLGALFVQGCLHLSYSAKGGMEKVVAMHGVNDQGKEFKVQKDWVSMWIYGLVGKEVPVDEWIAQEIGKDRTAFNVKIESQMSFLNGLVNMITFGIYSPQSIKITGEYK